MYRSYRVEDVKQPIVAWRETGLLWALLAIASSILVFVFYDGLELMVEWWTTREEYSHGFLIPVISLYLIWQKKHLLEQLEFTGSWLGVAITFIGAGIFILAELGGVYTIIQYSFLLTLYGVLLSLAGVKAFKVVGIPLLILIFMLPLPNFLYNDLSSQLQLISSEIGVFVIRSFGISVFLEGNVIDLGSYKLQVVEACNGLRYLFPLMTLGFIMAYFYHATMWKRVIIFLSTIPITILMNSFRIGVIGVMVEHWGQGMAEGFLHDFEGWVIFMACFGILFIEMWLLMRITKDKRPLKEAFGIDPPEPTPQGATLLARTLPVQFPSAIVVLLATLVGAVFIGERQETVPVRKPFIEFPLTLNGWEGRESTMEQIFIDRLKLTDYAMINYIGPSDGEVVNFYSAYYKSQRKDSTTHSPRACIPGGGWQIVRHEQQKVEGVSVGDIPLVVNRLVIQKDKIKQLVYYWFQQRGRVITNESVVKWYFFVDSIQRNRTDGALVRLTTTLKPGQDINIADERLREFASNISQLLPQYVPE